MQHVTAYYLDARDGHPATEASLRHGPVKPSENLEIDAVDRRETPPLIIGRVPDNEPMAAGMTAITEAEHAELMENYQAWRAQLVHDRREAMVVSRFQARAAIYQAGLLDQVQALMDNPDTDMVTKLAWQDAQEFKRLSPTVQALASALSLDDAAVDQLFEQAAQIEA